MGSYQGSMQSAPMDRTIQPYGANQNKLERNTTKSIFEGKNNDKIRSRH